MKGRRPSMTSVGRRLARPASRSVALALAALLVSGCATTKVDRSSDAAIVERVLTLIKQRLDVAPAVARAKWNSRASIEDPAREQACEEADDDTILRKDANGRVIGFEKLNVDLDAGVRGVTVEVVTSP